MTWRNDFQIGFDGAKARREARNPRLPRTYTSAAAWSRVPKPHSYNMAALMTSVATAGALSARASSAVSGSRTVAGR